MPMMWRSPAQRQHRAKLERGKRAWRIDRRRKGSLKSTRDNDAGPRSSGTVKATALQKSIGSEATKATASRCKPINCRLPRPSGNPVAEDDIDQEEPAIGKGIEIAMAAFKPGIGQDI